MELGKCFRCAVACWTVPRCARAVATSSKPGGFARDCGNARLGPDDDCSHAKQRCGGLPQGECVKRHGHSMRRSRGSSTLGRSRDLGRQRMRSASRAVGAVSRTGCAAAWLLAPLALISASASHGDSLVNPTPAQINALAPRTSAGVGAVAVTRTSLPPQTTPVYVPPAVHPVGLPAPTALPRPMNALPVAASSPPELLSPSLIQGISQGAQWAPPRPDLPAPRPDQLPRTGLAPTP